MRFKIDENLHPDVVSLLRDASHDALSVWDQELGGAKDPRLAEVCRAEGRVLMTFDLGFGDIRRYPPPESPGFVVLRLGSQSRVHTLAVIRRLVPLFATVPLQGRLWVVTEHEVRVRAAERQDSKDT
jgi:predicted nuclease of predicted toxin-antitoxin system